MQQKEISVRCSSAVRLKTLLMAEHLVVKHGMKGLCYLLTSDMQRISSSDMRGALAEAITALMLSASDDGAGADGDATLPSPSLEPGKGNPVSGTAHAEGEGSHKQQTFRDFYVKTFSSAFASELFDLRQVSTATTETQLHSIKLHVPLAAQLCLQVNSRIL